MARAHSRSNLLARPPLWIPFVIGLSLTLATAFFNIGFIAIDDYEYTVNLVVPAEGQSLEKIVGGVDMRSPVPSLLLNGIARIASAIGIKKPANQYRFVLCWLGIFSFTICFIVGQYCLGDPRLEAARLTSAWLMALYFAMPLLCSRSMYESLSIPFLMISLAAAVSFWRSPSFPSLLTAIFFVTLSAMLRFQTGLCGIAILLLPALQRRWKVVAVAAVFALVLFILSGLPDFFLKGTWHISLRDYFFYNMDHSSSFGRMPFYVYLGIFTALTLPPTLLLWYRKFPWVSTYASLLPVLLYFTIFITIHSLIPHKEERFVIPMLPIFLVLCAPLYEYAARAAWRFYFSFALNTALLVLVCFTEPQKNIIELVQYLDEVPQLRRVVSVEDSLVVFPVAFMRKPPEHKAGPVSWFRPSLAESCDARLVIRPAHRDQLNLHAFTLERTFEPGWLEAQMVKYNPKHNARRGSLELYVASRCLK